MVFNYFPAGDVIWVLILKQLRTYNKEKRAIALQSDADKLRRVLVHAIRWAHPLNRDDIEHQIPTCIDFLNQFDDIFTTNYDLLLYWVRLDNPRDFADGFGLAEPENGFRGPFNVEGHCNVFNLHGGLHLFEKSNGDLEKRIMEPDGLVAAIGRTIANDKRLPLWVAEGTHLQKLSRIYGSSYLSHCFEKLKAAGGAFFIYGMAASEKDAHIYEALFRSEKISHLYYCIHQPTAVLEEVAGELARFKQRTGSEVEYSFVDSETAPVWPT